MPSGIELFAILFFGFIVPAVILVFVVGDRRQSPAWIACALGSWVGAIIAIALMVRAPRGDEKVARVAGESKQAQTASAHDLDPDEPIKPYSRKWPGPITKRERDAIIVFAVSTLALLVAWFVLISLRAPLSSVDLAIVRDPGLPLLFDPGVENLVNTTLIIALGAAGYFGCLWALHRGFRHAFPIAMAVVILASIALIPASPLTSPDATHLASDVRALWLHGRYPTADNGVPAVVAAETGDPVAALVNDFENAPSSYGPVAYLAGGLSLPFVGDNFRANIAGVKAVAGLFLVLTAFVGGLAARQIGRDPAVVAALIGLNPLMLWEFPGNGHNDTIMTAFAVAAVLFLVREPWRDRAVGAGLGAASVLSKWALAPAAPLVGAYWFPRFRLLFAALVLVGGAALVYVVLDPPRGVGPAAVITRGGWAVIWDWLGGSDNVDRRWIVGAAYGTFMAIAAYMTWRAPLRNGQQLIAAAAILLFFFIFVGYAGYRPWYIAWFFPLAMIAGVRWLTRASIVFTFGAFLIVLAANWQSNIVVDMNISQPIQKASFVTWVAVAAVALGTWWYDREKAGTAVAAPTRRRTQARRKPIRSR
ncbi:MAG: hypothetical protein ACSLFM_04535 [Tepidiformaceae bacterium]